MLVNAGVGDKLEVGGAMVSWVVFSMVIVGARVRVAVGAFKVGVRVLEMLPGVPVPAVPLGVAVGGVVVKVAVGGVPVTDGLGEGVVVSDPLGVVVALPVGVNVGNVPLGVGL